MSVFSTGELSVGMLETLPVDVCFGGGTSRFGGGTSREEWLHSLIDTCPSILPVSDLHPVRDDLVSLCRQLITPAGMIDKLLITPDGAVFVVETRLWHTPLASYRVISQCLDCANALLGWGYEDLERATRRARANRDLLLSDLITGLHEVSLDLAGGEAAPPRLRLAGVLFVVAVDGLQGSRTWLVQSLNGRNGWDFAVSFVELSLISFSDEGEGEISVEPLVMTRTVGIEHPAGGHRGDGALLGAVPVGSDRAGRQVVAMG